MALIPPPPCFVLKVIFSLSFFSVTRYPPLQDFVTAIEAATAAYGGVDHFFLNAGMSMTEN